MADRARPTKRLLSWLVDYAVILGWLGVMFLVVGLPGLVGWVDLDAIWSSRVASDIAISLLTVVPLFVYLVVTESSPAHATLGKRVAGLRVRSSSGGDPSRFGVVTRNLVKVIPWQLGHMGTARLIATETEVMGLVFNITALLLLAAVVAPPLVAKRGVHDVLAATMVVSSAT